MRLHLLTASLLCSMALTGCADHAARIVAVDPGTQPPIGPGDGSTIGGGGGGGGDTGGGGTGGGSGGGDLTGGGGSNGGGGGGPTSPLTPGDNVSDGGAGDGVLGGGGGGPGGSPVPEPGTMLLVGTGLAGAALMRRRQKAQKTESEAK